MATTRAVLPDWEIRELIRTQPVGRVCFLEDGHPIALPVNYRIEDDPALMVVIRTAPGTALAGYSGPASLEVDRIDLEAGTAWSILLRGELRATEGRRLLPDPHPWISENRSVWMTMPVSAMSGRRFTARPIGDGYSVEWEMAPF